MILKLDVDSATLERDQREVDLITISCEEDHLGARVLSVSVVGLLLSLGHQDDQISCLIVVKSQLDGLLDPSIHFDVGGQLNDFYLSGEVLVVHFDVTVFNSLHNLVKLLLFDPNLLSQVPNLSRDVAHRHFFGLYSLPLRLELVVSGDHFEVPDLHLLGLEVKRRDLDSLLINDHCWPC